MKPAGWGTWSADRPVELVHPTSGLTVTPVLYSARAGTISRIGMGPDLTLGERSLDGRSIAFRTGHAETALHWRYALGDGNTATIDWETRANGEWGLRFWVILCLSGYGFTFRHDPETGRVTAAKGETAFEIVSAKKPLLVTAHADLDALEAEYHEHGYFYLASRATEGEFLALRFNLEEGPAMRIAIAPQGTIADRPALPEHAIGLITGAAAQPLQAAHDVMAWNHVHDHVNDRPYTVLTRFWNSHKFGGFGVWMNDIIYNAMLWGLFDEHAARANLEAVFAWQTEDGNFPCLITGNDQWLDRSQPPIVSYAVWSLAARFGDTGLLEWAYPALKRNHDWWWRRRSAGEKGLVVYGTSLDVGEGLYKGTKLAAKDESSMDNMAVHDPAPFDEETGLLMSYDVGLNSLLALDGECLSLIADRLGRADEADRYRASSDAHKQAIRTHLWDETRGVFANRLLEGDFVEPLAPTSFYPMAAGAATADQVDSLIANYLTNEDKFGGAPGLPSATRDHPAYHDNVYWRGRIWAPLNFWTWQGLRRAGREGEARDLAGMSWALFSNGWRDRQCGENYNAETGAILDQADTDAFYSWGALMAMMPVATALDVTPWQGFSLDRPLDAAPVGPVASPLGALNVTVEDGVLRARCGDAVLIETSLGGLRHIDWTEAGFSAEIPAGPAGDWIALPGRDMRDAVLDGEPIAAGPAGRIHLPDRPSPSTLVVPGAGLS